MKRFVHSNEDIMCMSNVRGMYVKIEDIPFSFYYSVQNGNHGPRVKVTMDSSKLRPNRMSTLKLCDDWELIANPEDTRINHRDLNLMKFFFRKYLILFLLTWEDKVDEPLLGDFMEGKISLQDFVKSLDFYEDYSQELDTIRDVVDLESFCKEHNLVNLYGN